MPDYFPNRKTLGANRKCTQNYKFYAALDAVV
jgi:hypothetical protein